MELNEIYNTWEEIIVNSKMELDEALQHTKNLVEAATTDEDMEEAQKVINLVNKRCEQVDRVSVKIRQTIKELSLLMHHWIEE